MKEENIYENNGKYINIVVKSPKYGEVKFLIDESDIDVVKKYHWGLYVRLYKGKVAKVYARGKKCILLHRLITGCPTGKEIDHLNGNTLDNRKCNLKICTHSENMQNRKMHTGNKTGVKNVHYDIGRRTYRVEIRKNNIRYYSKKFHTIKEAQQCAIEMRNKIYA